MVFTERGAVAGCDREVVGRDGDAVLLAEHVREALAHAEKVDRLAVLHHERVGLRRHHLAPAAPPATVRVGGA